MKQTFKFLTLSRVFNDCRDSVGRLSTLILLLFALSFGFSSQVWAENGFVKATMWYNVNNENKSYDYNNNNGDIDLGTLTTDFKLTGLTIEVWDNWTSGLAYNHSALYWEGNGEYKVDYRTGKTGNNYQFKAENCNFVIIKHDEGNSGTHTKEYWMHVWGDNQGGGNNWIKNGNNNCKWTYTILPPAVSNFGVTPSGSVAGTGTSSDPFIMPYNGTLTLTVNSLSQAHTDANSTLSLTGTANSKAITPNNNVFNVEKIINTSSTYSVTISAKYHNSLANLDGAESKVTYYYKTERYDVTLMHNDGTQNSTNVTVGLYSTNLSQLSNVPTRTGYELDGYYTDNVKTTLVASKAKTPALQASVDGYTNESSQWTRRSATSLYAGWKAATYTVTLDKDGGSNGASSVTATYDAAMPTLASTPTKSGYDFGGYFDQKNGQGTQYYNADKSSAHIWDKAEAATLYAYWVPKTYTVTLSQTHATTQGTTSVTATYNAVLPAIETLPQRTGYTFGGYNTNTSLLLVNAQGEWQKSVTGFTDAEGKWTKTDDATLSPIWNPITTTVTLKANGGTGEDQEFDVIFDDDINTTGLTAHSLTGHDLKGYFTAATGGSKILKEDLSVRDGSSAISGWLSTTNKWKNPNPTADLFAQWQAHQWTITLNDGEGSGGDGSKLVTYGTNIGITSVTKPTRETYNFAGYEDANQVLVYDANGALITNAMGYTDASKKWIYDGDVTLSAKWISAGNYVITLDNLSATTSGTLSVDVQINTTKGLTEYITCPTKTGYTFGGYFTETGGSGTKLINADGSWVIPASGFIDGEGKWIKNENVTLKAKWDANKTIVTFDNQGATTAGTTKRTLTYNSTDFGSTFDSPAKTGYTFGGYFTEINGGGTQLISAEGAWIAGVEGYTSNDASIRWIKTTTDPLTLYAKWTPIIYTINYVATDATGGSTASSTHTYDVEQALTTNGFTRAYTVTYDYQGATSGNSEANATATYTFRHWTCSANVNTYTDKQSVTNLASTQDAVVTMTAQWTSASVTLPTPQKTGYTFDGWYNNSSKIGEAGASYTPEADITLTAQWIEIMSSLSTAVNTMGTTAGQTAPAKSVENIGVTTTASITASAAKAGYTFEGWTLTNCARIDGGAEKALEITIKGLGNTNPATVTANYAEDLSTNWKLVGDNKSGSPFGDNYTYANGKPMTKAPGHSTENIAYYSLNVTTLGTFDFKVAKATGNENFYGWGTNNDDHITFNRDASGTEMQVYSGNQHPLKFTPDMVGEYVFKVDYTTNDVVKVTVTYPTTTTYNVDIYYDGVTKTTVEGGAFAKSITAQVPESMRFDHWVVESETTHVNITDVYSQTTTFTASGEGAVIRAKFNTNKRIYLKGGSNFSDAYINFYKSDYWDKDNKGTGNKGSECVQKNQRMTKIKNTDIFWYDLNYASNDWKNYFSFVNKGDESDNFYMCNVVYRNDMKDALPFYVPRNGYANEHHNSSQYFNEGIWMKYNDTYSGYKLHIIKTGDWEHNYNFNAETPGGYEFKAAVSLEAGVTYKFQIFNENNTWYGATGQTMTATSCTNWKMHLNNEDCQITTSEAGDYTFVLNLGSGEVIVSVEYPLSDDDYRVVAKEGETDKWVGDLIKNSGSVAKKDTTSFFNNNYTFQLQQYAGEDTWNNIGDEVTITDDKAKVGVINLIVEQDGQGNATLTYEGVYKGNYYIRTDGVDGGWGSYKTNPDNKMDNYGSSLVADPDYQYDVYKAKWVLSGKNVKFRIANDYSKAISDELKEDVIIGNKETLPQGANVRFMWNSKTNQLKRAYISGSTDTKDRYLVLEGDAKMFDKDGKALTEEGGGKVVGLDDYELNFEDKNNWVYQADIKAQSGCAVKLTAKYNNQVQYFIGAAGEGTGSRKTIIAGNGTDKYTMRVVYDFKTNLLIAGWVPSDTIKSDIALGGDMLITRTHQDSAQQIIFGGNVSISDIHHVYGVLSIKKDTMLGKETSPKYKKPATNADYDRTMYWISFPFKVKISEIFGVDGYGTKWIMQKYRGDLRAQKGWFKEDTPTFWEYMDVTDSLNAYEGYLFLIDANYFNTEEADVWKNSATEANFYFPSASGNIGIINKFEYTQKVPAHECGIDREFEVDGVGTVNHKNTDSYWNVIGVPAFQNKSMVLGTETETNMKAIYKWNSEYNTYTPQALADEFRFQTMHAYMVQFGGDITWSDVSVVNNNPATAPRYAYADTKNYFIKLFFGNGEAEDHAYINLADEASTDFVLNEDMMKLDNAGFPNIYSFAGNYNVAYNETKMTNQSITIGVSAPKNGSYTFSMPKDFSGSAILVDLEEGTYTDLNVSNYSVDLNKGTYNNRFQLMLEVEAKTPTNIQNANGGLWSEDGKTQKLLINDQIYLINGGRVYNATGVQLR